jgi:hypothetical protein
MSDWMSLTAASLVVGWDEECGLSWAGARDRPGEVPPLRHWAWLVTALGETGCFVIGMQAEPQGQPAP